MALIYLMSRLLKKIRTHLGNAVLALMLAGCAAIPSAEERKATADQLASAHQWHGVTIHAGKFALVAYLPERTSAGGELTIYIEGDGFAWISPSQPSFDPTPLDPLALHLALAQPSGNAVYLGRPCQYVDAEAVGCDMRYWTEGRFAPEVVGANMLAVDWLKKRYGANRLTLVGYSGGASVAALLAERRSDVDRLVTVAGNLDPRAWALYHHVRPLSGSLDPVDGIKALASVEQWHLVGADDAVVPPALVEDFAKRTTAAQRPHVLVEPRFDHHCCWVKAWPQLWKMVSDPE